ncbi:MAG: hypothetical protein Q4C96_05590 [Planctomycetia bacterium]|nr:hypothetical protein [Planctomycetia bacterium]
MKFSFLFRIICFFGVLSPALFWEDYDYKESLMAQTAKLPDGKNLTELQKVETPSLKASPSKKSDRGFRFSDFLPGGKEDSSKRIPSESLSNIPHAKIEDVIPEHALLIFRTPSLNLLNDRGRHLLSRLGLGMFAPMDWLKLTPYAKCLPYVDMKRQSAIIYVPYGNLPARVLIIPVKDYKNFIRTLGANMENLPNPLREGYVSVLSAPANHLVYLKGGYAILVEPVSKEMIQYLWSAQPFSARHTFTLSGMKHSHLSLEITRGGILHLTELAKIVLGDFAPVFSEAMKSLNIPDPELDLAEGYFNRALKAVHWMESNLASIRLDASIQKDTTLMSLTLSPQPNSRLLSQVRDSSGPLISTTLEMEHFLKIVPDISTSLAGQVDVTKDVASQLQAPFNRVRHVEYSFILPEPNDLLAERWCFFLEVDDAAAFVQELIIPKAQMIGSHIGAAAVGDIGAKIAENLALGRQERQTRRALRNRPVLLRPADPQRAAAVGGELGAKLGALIGKSAGEKEGMKEYSFDGYPLYISDLELYAREMKKIQAEQEGDFSHRPAVPENLRLINLIQRSVVGLQTGDLQRSFGGIIQQFMDTEAAGAPPILLARRNLVLILDPHHILIVPGDETILRMAKDNWEKIRHLYAPPQPLPPPPEPPHNYGIPSGLSASEFMYPFRSPEFMPYTLPFLLTGTINAKNVSSAEHFFTWQDSWNAIRKEVPSPENMILRTAFCFDGVNFQQTCNYIRQNYAPALPHPFPTPLPPDSPPALTISTVAHENAFLYISVPHVLSKNFLNMYVEAMKQKQQLSESHPLQKNTQKPSQNITPLKNFESILK